MPAANSRTKPRRRNTHKAKLTADQVRAIRSTHLAYVRGYGYLADMYNVGASTIRDIVTFQTWRHVP